MSPIAAQSVEIVVFAIWNKMNLYPTYVNMLNEEKMMALMKIFKSMNPNKRIIGNNHLLLNH